MVDCSNLWQVLDIPDNIIRRFGNWEITFRQGGKVNSITNNYNGDYEIWINGQRYTDLQMYELLTRSISANNNQLLERIFLILETLWRNQPHIEQIIYDRINNLSTYFPLTMRIINASNSNIPVENIQLFLYYSWHRFHIEERAYPSCAGYNGRGDYLGAIYLLLANNYNLPIDDNLQAPTYGNPQYVFNTLRRASNTKRKAFQNYLNWIRDNQTLPL